MKNVLIDLLILGGIASLSAGVFLQFGLPASLMTTGLISLVIGLQAARNK